LASRVKPPSASGYSLKLSIRKNAYTNVRVPV
jgi:hypothetical protein